MPVEGGLTILSIAGVLGGLVTVAGGDSGPSVTHIVIHDPAQNSACGAGALVLGVGLNAVGVAPGLIAALARAGAAGLVLRRPGDPSAELRVEAEAWALPLVVVDDLPWEDLFRLAQRALAAAAGEAGPPDSPDSHVRSLFDLATGLAAATGSAVAIEDHDSRILAFSPNHADADPPRVASVLAGEVSPEWRKRVAEARVLERLRASEEPIDVQLAGLGPRTVVGIHASHRLLGSIWAATTGPLGAPQRSAMVSAARTAGLLIVQREAAEFAERSRRSELCTRLLTGEGDLTGAARGLGLSTCASVVVAARPDERSAFPAARAAELQRVSDVLSLHLGAVQPGCFTTVRDGTAYALVAVDGDGARPGSRLRRALDDLAGHKELPFTAGLGDPARTPEEVRSSRADADAVLDVLPMGGVRVADGAQTWGELVLARVRPDERMRELFRRGPITALLAHDDAHGTAFVASLSCYLDAHGEMAAAADRLHVHPNTLRHRLRRTAHITGLDLDDPVTRLAATLQLRLVRPAPTGSRRDDSNGKPPA